MSSEKLDDAVQLIKSGNPQAAVPILKRILLANPKDENAWLWLYACVSSVEEKKYCLQKALEINPGNPPARKALEKLNASTTFQPPAPAPAASTFLFANDALDKPKSKLPWVFGLGGFFVFLLCIGASVFLVNILRYPVFGGNPFGGGALPTSAAFHPGDPTATPLGRDIADPNFQKGVDAYTAKNYRMAVVLMSAVIIANPDLAPPYRYRGMAYWYLKDCASGFTDLERALSINPNYASAWAGRGILNDCLGNQQQAMSDYQKALSLDGSLAVAHHNLGSSYYQLHNYTRSLDEYSLAVAIDPSRSGAWSGRSEALARLNRFDECLESATKALDINAKEWLAYTDRASCETSLQQYDDAIKDYTTYIDARQDTDFYIAWARINRGEDYYALKDYNKAIADYKLAEPYVIGNAHLYCQFAYAYFEVQQYQDTLDAGKTSIAINPECGGKRLLTIMARSSSALGDHAQALDYMSQVFAKGADPLDYYYRGIIFQAAGKNTEAIQDLKQFLASNPASKEGEDARARLAKLAP